uniref:hypothetical protein n=1 Tax=uncultured Halomonas sp. TaxID=173971 RepID=UPI00262A6F7A|nr:hypothetical protein [uncultured Halomonas sp.]
MTGHAFDLTSKPSDNAHFEGFGLVFGEQPGKADEFQARIDEGALRVITGNR